MISERDGELVLGIMGGSGLYDLDALEDLRTERVDTPFGDPSDVLVTGTLDRVRMVFLPRHGRGHRLSPSEVNYRANIFAMKKMGVSRLISVSAVGSMREEIRPGDFVVCDQFFDRTRGRPATFFEGGLVAHVAFADPVCPDLSRWLVETGLERGDRMHSGGTYLAIEGPQFSTRAESKVYRAWGVDVIGMTNLPEARLAREAEMCYATLAMATDYDCWHETEDDISVTAVLDVLRSNAARAREIIQCVGKKIARERTCGCAQALQGAIVSDPAQVPKGVRESLGLLLGKRLGGGVGNRKD